MHLMGDFLPAPFFSAFQEIETLNFNLYYRVKMLSMSMTRNRRAEKETKLHHKAIRQALERKADREFAKANPDVLTEEEELEEKHQEKDQKPKEFFDVCNEKEELKKDKSKKKKPKKSKKKENNIKP